MSNETTKLRQIQPLKITDLLPASILESDGKPEFTWVDPSTLCIEEKYQRNLAERSVTLIRKIYRDFSWNRFKPPVCAWGPNNKLFVIDGQHTAIAAASHPKLKKIPVMIVSANTMKERAGAFMGHNRDRLAVTPAQLYYSAVAAEDPIALIVQKALKDTGCVVVRYNPPIWVEGQTMGVGTILSLAERKGCAGLTRVLKILMDAKRAPITALEVSAVADLIWGKEWQGKITDYDLATTIRSKTADQWKATAEANVRKGMTMAMKRAVAITWYRATPKKKGK